MRFKKLLAALVLGSGLLLGSCGSKTPTYTVTWMVEGEVVETDTGVKAGELPSYDGDTPTKSVSAEDKTTIAYYSFTGWTPEVSAVTGNTTYTATFEPVLTYDLAYAACVNAVTLVFGESAVATLVKDEWETKSAIRFTANVGTTVTPEQGATVLNSVLVTSMGYTAIQEIAYNETSGYYIGSYLDTVTGVVAYPLTAASSGNTILQIQFTHYNMLSA